MMKTISSVAILSTFLASNASAFVPSQPSTAFRPPSVVVPTIAHPNQRLSTLLVMAGKEPNVLERILGETKTQEEKITVAPPAASTPESAGVVVVEENKEMTETQALMQKVKDAGAAGIVSYALWELAFWIVSVPLVISAYYGLTGHFPDLTDKDDLAKLGAEAFAFVNVARFAVPLRIGLALSTTPWIQENVMNRFFKNKDDDDQNNINNKQEDDIVVETYDPAETMRNFFNKK
jgi:hypothetical protein